jgi:hypothetical protein
MIRGAQAAERGLQGAGACSGPRGSPGQHARLWVSRCRLLKRRSSIVGGRSMMIVLLLFLQKQSLAFAVYLFGIGTLHTGPGLKKKTHVIMLSP